jgi:hypothetical protein
MPYFQERGQKQYEYEGAKGTFQSEDLELLSRQTYTLLRELGVQAVRCRYNGGSDEGWAYLNEVVLKDTKVDVDELKHQLANSSLGDIPSLGDISEPDERLLAIARSLHRTYSPLSRPDRVQSRFDRFARELAGCLLGNPYGVGELSMKGWFHADLITGEIVDMRKRDYMNVNQYL